MHSSEVHHSVEQTNVNVYRANSLLISIRQKYKWKFNFIMMNNFFKRLLSDCIFYISGIAFSFLVGSFTQILCNWFYIFKCQFLINKLCFKLIYCFCPVCKYKVKYMCIAGQLFCGSRFLKAKLFYN